MRVSLYRDRMRGQQGLDLGGGTGKPDTDLPDGRVCLLPPGGPAGHRWPLAWRKLPACWCRSRLA